MTVNTDQTAEAPVDLDKDTATPAWAQVAVLGGDVANIDVTEGKTIAQALEDAGVTVEHGQSVSVNGEMITDFEQPLQPGTVVAVVTKIRNGSLG